MKVDKAWVTLLTKESYLAGCLVLDYTLRKVESAYPLVVFATPDLPARARDVLRERGVHLRDIDFLEPAAEHRSQFPEHDHRFAETWTKLRCFELTEYEVSASDAEVPTGLLTELATSASSCSIATCSSSATWTSS